MGIIDNLTAMDDLSEFLNLVKQNVDAALDRLIPGAEVEPTRLHSAVRWSVFAGGKRIRPALVFASGKVFGTSEKELSATAAAIEMIHTYSLIHDDLPAMDDDDLRRGKPTCHRQFDEATAILAGDVLQTLAFKAIAEDEALSADIRIRLIGLIASAAGTPDGMVAGQQLDLDAEGGNLTIDQIERIHRSKTGALITVSAMAGALVAKASKDELTAVEQYAQNLGLLFQVTDDLLDVTAATESLGKTAGKDISSEKATYPKLLGIDATAKFAIELSGKACQAISTLHRDTTTLKRLAETLLNRKR